MAISENGRQLGKALLTTVRDRDAATLYENRTVFCTVTAVSGTLVSVKTSNAQTGGHLVARFDGPTPTVGDRGVLIPVDGSFVFSPLATSDWDPDDFLTEVDAMWNYKVKLPSHPTVIFSTGEMLTESGNTATINVVGSPTTGGGKADAGWNLNTGGQTITVGNPEWWLGEWWGEIAVRYTMQNNPSHAGAWIFLAGLWMDSFLGLLRVGNGVQIYYQGPGGANAYASPTIPIAPGYHTSNLSYEGDGVRLFIDGELAHFQPMAPAQRFVWGSGKGLEMGGITAAGGPAPNVNLEAVALFPRPLNAPGRRWMHGMEDRWAMAVLEPNQSLFQVRGVEAKAEAYTTTANTATPATALSFQMPVPISGARILLRATAILSRSINSGGIRFILRVNPGNIVNFVDLTAGQVANLQNEHRLEVPLGFRVWSPSAIYTATVEYHGLTTAGTTGIRQVILTGMLSLYAM